MAFAEYLNAQTRLQMILANCKDWDPQQLDRALDGLLGSVRQMVRVRQAIRETPLDRAEPLTLRIVSTDVDAQHGPNTPPGPPPVARVMPSAIAVTPPGPPPVARVMPYQTGELRPRAAPIRTSVTLQQMRASSAVTAAVLAPNPHISWQIYSSIYMKKRAIGAAKFNAKCDAPCSICFETHTNGESVVTEECNHRFGKLCWQNWMSYPNSNQSCPECRTPCPNTLFYSQRSERKSKNNSASDVIVIDN